MVLQAVAHRAMSPHVTLTMLLVTPAARSEARNAATSATCWSTGARLSIVICEMAWMTISGSGTFGPPTLAIFSLVRLSATAAVQMPATRTPCGPVSAARYRMNVSTAASAGPVPPIIGAAVEAEDDARAVTDHVPGGRAGGD